MLFKHYTKEYPFFSLNYRCPDSASESESQHHD